MADSLSLGDSLLFFPHPFSPGDTSHWGGLAYRERGECVKGRNEQMADEGKDVDKNRGRVVVIGDGDVFATEIRR